MSRPTPPLPGQTEFVSRLAQRFPVDRAVLERIARRVLEEEAERRAAGSAPSPPEVLLERASRLLAAAVPQPPDDEDPFQAEDEESLHRFGLAEPEPDAPFVVEEQPDLMEAPVPQRRGLLPALLIVLVVLVGAGVAYYLVVMRDVDTEPDTFAVEPAPSGALEPGAGAALEPEGTTGAAVEPAIDPTEPAPEPTTAPEPTAAPEPTRLPPGTMPPASAASAPAGHQTRAATFATSDWSGPAFYAVHFSSYRDRDAADRDARQLSAQYSLPARALAADLGDQGVWYRVMLGDFTDSDQALAFRNDLADRGTPELGWVYRVTGQR